MNLTTFLRLSGGVGIAIVMWIYLPVLDLLNLAFLVLLGLFWGLIVVDIALVSSGAIVDLGSGVSAWGTGAVARARAKVKDIKSDLAAKVEDIQAQEAVA